MLSDTWKWEATPRTRRLAADLAETLRINTRQVGQVALLVGAGLDSQLTGRVGWADFVANLAKSSGLPDVEAEPLRHLANIVPVEAAEALRVAVGTTEYKNALRTATAHRDQTEQGAQMAQVLSALISNGVNVIINFNYTHDLEQAISDATINQEVVVVQRTHLSGWAKLDLLSPPTGVIHLIAIHGRVDDHLRDLSVVLDRQSYSDAIYSDRNYSDLLFRLLQDYIVISIGLSWNDVVLRDAAARVRYSSRIYGRTHAAFLSRTSDSSQPGCDAERLDLWRERSLVSAYAVRPLFYKSDDGHRELLTAVNSVSELHTEITALRESNPDPPAWPDFNLLSPMADLLDACGDYESLFHRWWFAKNWNRLPTLIGQCTVSETSPDQWVILARLERHLRHQLWVYAGLNQRQALREHVWLKVASIGMELVRAGATDIWNCEEIIDALGPTNRVRARGIFEFALGAYELTPRQDSPTEVVLFWRERLREIRHPRLRSRIQVAQRVWSRQRNKAIPGLYSLRVRALEAGWEAIEAKIALDICEVRFKRHKVRSGKAPRDLPEPIRAQLLTCAIDAREAARVAGSPSRELGAVTLGSLVADPDFAEADLIGVNQGFSKRSLEGAGPVGDWAIYVGLLASLLDRLGSGARSITVSEARAWIEERCGKIRAEPLRQTEVHRVISDYWDDYHPKAAQLAKEVAEAVRLGATRTV